MKQILIVFAFLAATQCSFGQSASGNGKWEDKATANSGTASKTGNEFTNTEMVQNGRAIKFIQLPKMKQAIFAVITDPNGDVVMQNSISYDKNNLDLRNLQKHKMYFVTLMYKSKSQKGFVLHL